MLNSTNPLHEPPIVVSAATAAATTAASASSSSGSSSSSSKLPSIDLLVPTALSDRDVKRLAWAVGRVRKIVAAMQEHGTIIMEHSPGLALDHINNSHSSSNNDNRNSSDNSHYSDGSDINQDEKLNIWVS